MDNMDITMHIEELAPGPPRKLPGTRWIAKVENINGKRKANLQRMKRVEDDYVLSSDEVEVVWT
jgi:hypothetical protein